MANLKAANLKAGKCFSCGRQKENKRSEYCDKCFENLLKTKDKE